MKYYFFLILGIILISGFACSGEDDPEKDTTPPTTPVMIAHLGDTGDASIIIDDVQVELNDENNGIDAVPDGQWIRLTWKPFIDTDLSHLKIYRFSDIDTTAVEIAQIPANEISYLDQDHLVERTWYSYFIELFDASGNSAVSDTVSYAILAKSYLLYPPNGETVSTSGLEFQWNTADDRTGVYRVLVWDENNELLWHNDLALATEDNPLKMPFPIINPPVPSGSTLRWRVDYFDWDEEHQLYIGSESAERIFHVQ